MKQFLFFVKFKCPNEKFYHAAIFLLTTDVWTFKKCFIGIQREREFSHFCEETTKRKMLEAMFWEMLPSLWYFTLNVLLRKAKFFLQLENREKHKVEEENLKTKNIIALNNLDSINVFSFLSSSSN